MPTKVTLATILLTLASATSLGCKSRACEHARDVVVEMTRKQMADVQADKEFTDELVAMYQEHYVPVCLESDAKTIACVKKIDELMEAHEAHSAQVEACLEGSASAVEACLEKAGDELDEKLGECGTPLESLMVKAQEAAFEAT